jgi:hypothetical protein
MPPTCCGPSLATIKEYQTQEEVTKKQWCRYHKMNYVYIFYHGATAPMGPGLLIIEESWTHSDTPHSVGLLWTSNQPDAQTSSWLITTLTRDGHPFPGGGGGVRTHNPSKWAVAEICLRPSSHWDLQLCTYRYLIQTCMFL